MPKRSPRPISEAQQGARQLLITLIAQELGFVGDVEYRHVYSQTGGAQYGRGSSEKDDLLTIYAEAFERSADPDDFTLCAMIAHERGHQILARHRRIAKRVSGISAASEEILASLIGAMLCGEGLDRITLYAKATAELLQHGQSPESTERQLQDLWDQLEALL